MHHWRCSSCWWGGYWWPRWPPSARMNGCYWTPSTSIHSYYYCNCISVENEISITAAPIVAIARAAAPSFATATPRGTSWSSIPWGCVVWPGSCRFRLISFCWWRAGSLPLPALSTSPSSRGSLPPVTPRVLSIWACCVPAPPCGCWLFRSF